jgi:hypothetical protein
LATPEVQQRAMLELNQGRLATSTPAEATINTLSTRTPIAFNQSSSISTPLPPQPSPLVLPAPCVHTALPTPHAQQVLVGQSLSPDVAVRHLISGKRSLTRVTSLSQPPQWTEDNQRQYESCIARITASANLPLCWVDDHEVKDFIGRFLPIARPVTRRVLTSQLLPTELETQRAAQVLRLRGAEATLQCDGWSGSNFHHCTAFTVTVSNEVYNIT